MRVAKLQNSRDGGGGQGGGAGGCKLEIAMMPASNLSVMPTDLH